MTLFSLTSLAIAVFFLAASPGPGVFAVIARSLASGLKPGLFMIAGIVTGDIIYLMFAVFGMALIAQTMGELFIIIKICGGAYLFWLGLKLWQEDPSSNSKVKQNKQQSYLADYISGLMITLSNPKVILFYCSFLPAFISLTELKPGDIFLTIVIVSFVLSTVLICYAFLALRAVKLFSTQKTPGKFNKFTGGVMMTVGIAVAVKQ